MMGSGDDHLRYIDDEHNLKAEPRDKIVAVSFLTADELVVAKQALKRIYSLPLDNGDFTPLLAAIARATKIVD